MEEINENVKSLKEKLKKLNDFIALSLKRNEISGDLRHLQSQASKIEDSVNIAHKLMQSHLDDVQNNYGNVLERIHSLQSTIMDYMINEKLNKLKLNKDMGDKVNKVVDEANLATPKAPLNNSTNTFKMKICEYKMSPLIKRKINTMPIQFSDFNAKITQEQYDSLPKYMCGRETLSNLNTFLENIIIPCFNEKYQLIHRPRSSIRKQEDLELWKTYNSQVSYLPKQRFITSDDIVRKLNKLIDKKTNNRLVILRHLRIIQEVRTNQVTCYIWST